MARVDDVGETRMLNRRHWDPNLGREIETLPLWQVAAAIRTAMRHAESVLDAANLIEALGVWIMPREHNRSRCPRCGAQLARTHEDGRRYGYCCACRHWVIIDERVS